MFRKTIAVFAAALVAVAGALAFWQGDFDSIKTSHAVTSPAVAALGVMYEPIIYFTDKSGVVVDRLDGVWDKSELRDRLAKLGF